MEKNVNIELNNNGFTAEDVLWSSEVAGNRFLVKNMIVCVALLAGTGIANRFGLFEVPASIMEVVSLVGIPVLLIPALFSMVLRHEKRWLKIFLVVMFIFVVAAVDAILTYNVELIIMLPVIFSIRYYNPRYTILSAAITAVAFFIVAVFFFDKGLIDLNFVDSAIYVHIEFYDHPVGDVFQPEDYIDPAVYGINFLTLHFLPKIMLFALISAISAWIAHCGKNMVLREREIKANSARIETELNLAANIQANMLPGVFPAFPEREEFSVYATMTPAREVGGDFYDFFMVDDTHVAIVAADVSDKGVPAAMFMAIGKTLLKDHSVPGADLGEVFSTVNRILCESNSEMFFITAFEGVLDLVTGEFRFVNAGHMMPFVCKKGEKFKPHPIEPGFVLAGLENMSFQSGELILEPGDKIFEYTDGVTEATDKDYRFYGMKRLEETLVRYSDKSVYELLPLVKEDIDAFTAGAPQFDDITMIVLEYAKRYDST